MPGKKVFLSLMPFWAPLNPPLGISLLQGYLKMHGFDVNIYDFNTEDELWKTVDMYFKILEEAVPRHSRSNFHMIGFDVFANHLAAYLHKTGDSKYHELLTILIRKNYFTRIDKDVVMAMDSVISDFYAALGNSIIKVIAEVRPDVFGISVFSPCLGPSLFAFKLVKERFPDIETVMGGGVFADHLALNSPNLRGFLQRTESYIDTIIIGEGELLFQEYLCGELKSHKRLYSLKDIHNRNLDLQRSLIPDFSGLNLEAYSQMAAYASRSCPFQCNFCSETIQWGKFRAKKGEQIAHEIAAVRKKYGGRLFMFGDSLMNPVITDLSHNLIKNEADIYWDGYLRTDANVCEPGNTDLWRRAGFYRARLGIESGSQRVLNLMNKKMTDEQIKKAVSSLANSGIKTTTYWVIGYPGETEEDFKETLRMLEELRDDIYEADWHPFYFFPDGQVRSLEWTKEYGIELLYPEEFNDLLLTQTWFLGTGPGREEIFARMNRFAEACKKLDIPNPYSMMSIYLADKRWKKLHPNCGPTILELHNSRHLD